MSDYELLPCPFCAASGDIMAVLTDAEIVGGDECWSDDCWAVCCQHSLDGCGATGGYRDSPEEAVAAWNRRDAAKMSGLTPEMRVFLGASWADKSLHDIVGRFMARFALPRDHAGTLLAQWVRETFWEEIT